MQPFLLKLLAGTLLIGCFVSCRPDPEVIEVPVPFAIDSLALLPQWENHPAFFGQRKQQWLGWADDSLCLLLGEGGVRLLDSSASILTDWDGYGIQISHNNPAFLPTMSRHWVLTQDVHHEVFRMGYSTISNTRTFFSLSEQAETRDLSFLARQSWTPKGQAAAFVKATPTEFSWIAWAEDTANEIGLVYIAGTLASLPGNPIVNRVEWHPLPGTANSVVTPAFLTKMGDAVLVGYGNSHDATNFFGEKLFIWRPEQGYEQITPDRYGMKTLQTSFSAHDGQSAFLMVGEGDLYEVRPDGNLQLIYSNLHASLRSHLWTGKDLRAYFALFFNRDLFLLDKTTGNIWKAPNLGLDGHNIGDITLFKDTLIVSSPTGGIFYQALSDVWPEDQR